MHRTALASLCLLVSPLLLDAAVSVGSPAPPIQLNTIDGKKISLSQLRGKRVLLFMWASW